MTETDICNRALALLGHDRQIADYASDTSAEGTRCRHFYDAAVRDCLSAHDWDFAAEEVPVAAVPPDAFGWVRLPLPPDSLRIISVRDGEGHPFRTERNARFLRARTFGAAATIRFVADGVHAADMPPKFAEAVIAQLAYLLAGPMYGDDAKTNRAYQFAKGLLSEAVAEEADETAYRGEWDNPFVRARR